MDEEVDMLYVLAVLVSPGAVLLCGQPQRALFTLLLWVSALLLISSVGFAPALLLPVAAALLVVHEHYRADRELTSMVRVARTRRASGAVVVGNHRP
jgi:hypothetical protein